MRPLQTRLEVVITDRQVDQDWQLTCLAATMRPHAKLIRRLDTEMIEALGTASDRPPAAGWPDRTPAVARAVGAMGLGLAAQTGGVCVDISGFKVRDPSDLVVRAA